MKKGGMARETGRIEMYKFKIPDRVWMAIFWNVFQIFATLVIVGLAMWRSAEGTMYGATTIFILPTNVLTIGLKMRIFGARLP